MGFWNLIRHRYFKAAAIISLVLMLPVFLITSQQQQDQRSKAETATALSFSPTSSKSKPVTSNINEQFSLDVVLSPGNNLISILKLDIEYDPTILELAENEPIVVNDDVFTEVLEGPLYQDGRILMTLSVGFDQTKAVSLEKKVVKINFNPKTNTNRSLLNFGPKNAAFSIGSEDENKDVISSMTPAYIKINKTTGKDSNKGKSPKR